MVGGFGPVGVILGGALSGSPPPPPATQGRAAETQPQEGQLGKPVLRVEVNLVQLNVAVTDAKGHYVTGLRPSNFAILEDNIPQKIASFGEGNGSQKSVDIAAESLKPEPINSTLAGANVFVLFDTSTYMYRNFALGQEAIADFVKSLDSPEPVAVSAYRRNLHLGAQLTADREQVLRGVRSTVAGE